MTAISDAGKETSREDDYRDQEARNLDDGWPYADVDAVARKRNEAYGVAPSDLGDDGNPGAEIASDPAIPGEGGPAFEQGTSKDATDDDALEERIFDRISSAPDIDDEQITVTVRDGIAELTGKVDQAETVFIAEQLAGAVPGVRLVRNGLVSMGVDSHVPDDATG
ncbi:MAG: BON domain-containing protein [Rhizobium sp.]|nr:BON domain-containing protein [Rhizobium sp.]